MVYSLYVHFMEPSINHEKSYSYQLLAMAHDPPCPTCKIRIATEQLLFSTDRSVNSTREDHAAASYTLGSNG